MRKQMSKVDWKVIDTKEFPEYISLGLMWLVKVLPCLGRVNQSRN
jgi:hypothetical protein